MISLNGLHILSTRPVYSDDFIAKAIKNAGGTLLAYPTMDIAPLDIKPHINWLNRIIPLLDGVIFTSPNAVIYSLEPLKKYHIVLPNTLPFMAIGARTATAVKTYSHPILNVPTTAGSETFLESHALQEIQNKQFLIFKGKNGRTLLSETLTKRGALIHECCVYERQLPHEMPFIDWHKTRIDIILFTSETSIHHLFSLVPKEQHNLLTNIPCLLVSERLLTAARTYGFRHPITCRIETIIEALDDFRRQHELK